ncbi:uncharacterized protein Z518_03245 [Rhinocladiella mackenziei CBS 650.93]|uniref:Cytochrome P450 n=1 Tax=Rhinocladiella mackenziei CBS 650.93 TaxID=1442369 RepID=A0A0D2IRJ0_9EURO|nr:uncharacterized protein Z518_03245 [Rhinocladiella mackenziei CBS 650.93]KIX08589.1 hypothetical protein Z518_03245 [Rhinocladiella mackenziei CBS 650.93]
MVYLVSLAIYRLWLSPLARIPGPKLAGLTLWYEFYYDVVQGGKYTWKIAEMHEKYGPIIRINPYEIHINDPDYYLEIYTGPSKRRDKWAWSAAMFGNSLSHFGAISHEEHRRKRSPLNPFFSKKSVVQLEPRIKEVVEKLCARLTGFKKTKEPVNLRHAFAAVAMDVITEYAFARSFNCLDEPDFAPSWPEAVDSVSEQSHLNKQFPWLLPLMRLIPLSVVEKVNPHMMRLIKLQIVSDIMSGKNADDRNWSHDTIFHELINTPEIPDEEKTLQYLVDEGQSIVAAGQVTTTHYLNTTAYHIVATPGVAEKLKAELVEAMPDGALPPLQKLEQLPYLSAVVQEGYRLSYGVTHRLQRISPDEPLFYHDFVIPAGTPVGMTSVLIHENPRYFLDPKQFQPDRWLNSDSQKLKRYLVNFSKGTRSCLGKELAQAEIYLTLAALFRRFDFELYKTARADIDVAHDFFNPQPRRGSKGLRVLIR